MRPRQGHPRFRTSDLDGDGLISEQEFHAARVQRMAERARQGYLLRSAGRHAGFTQLDRNADGNLTPEEVSAARAARWAQPPRYRGLARPWYPCWARGF